MVEIVFSWEKVRLFQLVLNVNVCDNFLEIEFLGIEPKFDGRRKIRGFVFTFSLKRCSWQ